MSRTNLQNIICCTLLGLIFLLSLVMRTAVPWDQVFSGNWIKFTDNDAYLYVRLLDNLSQHFPHLDSYDPYYIYPGGGNFGGRPFFFVYLMGVIAWLAGGGTPSQHTVDLVAVFFPAVLGALLVFPIFFTGKTIFNRWAGLIAAGFTALMPGEFLVRTLLGNTDSHVLEIFLSTFFMLFLLLSAHHGRGLTVYPWRRENRQGIARPLIYGALAGLGLGLYLLSWQGGLLFVLISFAWLILQCISDHLRARTPDGPALACFSAYLTALAMVLIWLPNALAIMALSAGLASAIALPLLSYYLHRIRANPVYYPAAITCAGIAAALGAYMISPQLYASAVGAVSGFFTWQYTAPIAEMQPLLVQQGSFTLALTWGNYTAASVMALVVLAVVLYRAFKRGEPGIVMLATWSIITLLAGYAGWLILNLAGLKDNPGEAKPVPSAGKTTKKKAAGAKQQQPGGNPTRLALGIAVVAALVVYPNTGPLPGGDRPFFDVATRALNAPSNAWCESLDWLRNNTPEPFGDAGYYYARYGSDNSSGPATAYSTLCLWDYGYWVSRIGHRVPCSSPGTSDTGEWRYFLAQSAREADNICSTWKVRYVMVNDYIVNCNSGFTAMAGSAGEPSSKYYEFYHRQQNGSLVPTLLYYPEFYRTMAVRLYCFDGLKYEPKETAVISWEDRPGSSSPPYREITGVRTFRSQPEAEAFISAQKTGNWRIVGKDPFASPVPLEALDGYRPAFASSQKARTGNGEAPEVKVFEYIR